MPQYKGFLATIELMDRNYEDIPYKARFKDGAILWCNGVAVTGLLRELL